jgi:hypothetical protein
VLCCLCEIVLCARHGCAGRGLAQQPRCGSATEEEFESRRISSYSLRLLPSLLEEARKAAASEGVSLNQLINVAVAEKVSALRTEIYLHERIRRANHEETLRILDRAVKGIPPTKVDKVLLGGLHGPPEAFSTRTQPVPVIGGSQGFGEKPQPEVQPAPPPDLERSAEIGNPFGRATPQFGQLKKRLDKVRGR